MLAGTREMKSERRGIHRIAELANVSIGTVDRALHGRNGIKESTRHHILQIASQIGYTPNLAARALSVSKSGVRIGVCIPREIRFFYDELWNGVLDEARRVAQLGVELLNRPVPSLGVGDTEAFEELVESGVQGIVLTAGDPEGLKPLIDSAEEKGIRRSLRIHRFSRKPKVNRYLCGTAAEWMSGRRVNGKVCSSGFESGRHCGHAECGRSSQEDGWLLRGLSTALPGRNDSNGH